MRNPPARRPAPSAPQTCAEERSLSSCGAEEEAFDLWLRGTLRAAFSQIATEPVPEDLLRMIEEDRAERERLRRRRLGLPE